MLLHLRRDRLCSRTSSVRDAAKGFCSTIAQSAILCHRVIWCAHPSPPHPPPSPPPSSIGLFREDNANTAVLGPLHLCTRSAIRRKRRRRRRLGGRKIERLRLMSPSFALHMYFFFLSAIDILHSRSCVRKRVGTAADFLFPPSAFKRNGRCWSRFAPKSQHLDTGGQAGCAGHDSHAPPGPKMTFDKPFRGEGERRNRRRGKYLGKKLQRSVINGYRSDLNTP